jgi:hypothetical protein
VGVRIKDLPEVVAVLKEANKPQFVVLRYEQYQKLVNSLDVAGTIDEAHYLNAHKDVATAFAAKKIGSPTLHYVKYGYFEKRVVKLK